MSACAQRAPTKAVNGRMGRLGLDNRIAVIRSGPSSSKVATSCVSAPGGWDIFNRRFWDIFSRR